MRAAAAAPAAVAHDDPFAAADFAISQVVDRTVGVHGLIRKAALDRP